MKTQFENYIKLYESGIPIKRINPIDDQTYRVLVNSNIDVRIIDRDKHLADIYDLTSLVNLTKDSDKYSNRFFYAIPVQTVKGTIVGFIFRSVYGKSYATVNREFTNSDYKLPIMFGFYKDFEGFDKHKICPPIVVCEGLKDCITLKKIYPYVLANNTSSMGMNLKVLSNLTDKFILVYDNDDAGQEGMKKDIARIAQYKGSSAKVLPKECYKDCADCYENREDFMEFAKRLKEAIKSLVNENNKSIGRNIIER